MAAKRLGRPKIPAKKRRKVQIMFRANATFAAMLKRAQRHQGAQSVSAVILDRLTVGIDESGYFLRDVAAALRIVGDWKTDAAKAAQIRAVARLLIEAHLGDGLPADVLESHRHGPVEARILAHVIIENRRSSHDLPNANSWEDLKDDI